MKLKLLLLLASTFLLKTDSSSQVIQNLSLELGYNFSTTLNKKNYTGYRIQPEGNGLQAHIEKQNNSWIENYNIGVKYEFHKFLNLKLKYSRFDFRRNISGYIIYGGFEPFKQDFSNYEERIGNRSIALINEIMLPLKCIDFSLETGIEYRKFHYNNDLIFLRNGPSIKNFALYYALGIQKQVYKTDKVIFRIFCSNSLKSKNGYLKNLTEDSMRFHPISYAFEIALNLKIPKRSKKSN